MFTSKGLFSEIECPYKDTCMLPRCIFAHSRSLPSTVTTVVENRSYEALDERQEQEGRRKRLKLADENERTVSNSDKASTGVQAVRKSSHLTSEDDTPEQNPKRISSLTRPVSPPALKNKSQNGNTTVTKDSQVQRGDTPASKPSPALKSTPIKLPAEKATPAKTPLKKEALNPRALKVPTPATYQIRFRLVQTLHEQLNRLNCELESDANDAEQQLVLPEQAIISMALDIEEDAAHTPSIYSNAVKNKILLYKRMKVGQWKEEREKEVARIKAKEAAAMSDTPDSRPKLPPKVIETGLKTEEEIMLLPRLYTPTTGLSKHGYVTSIPTDDEIEMARKGVEAAKGWEVCDRCKSRFQVFPGRREEDGALASGGKCTYHWGKALLAERSATDPKAKRERRFKCCGQAMGDSAGCTQADCHVFKISEVKRLAAVLNFEKTPENPAKAFSNPVCIDGEMGYTVYGLELIRLTATSWPSGTPLFDVLVRPVGEILDLNSRFSGVWPNQMGEAKPFSSSTKPLPETPELQIVSSPAEARALLFSHLSPETPLIGHGLENDLNASRIIHTTIIDTALLFPHKAGLPYRNGLKMLMSTHLNRDIQIQAVVDGKMEGHDSKEDANAAGELVRWRVGELWGKMEREGWVVENGGVFVPPDGSGDGLERRGGELGVGAGTKRGWDEDGDE
ncbi:RNA exonuclease [Lachnellula occidentalis]|uniref:RNA exonuclease n=1 Tax=Lachnellula occidentalis TaxID=215460 RepID=A0A8H8UK94_9HELO|nr:RNA exonuclease [Lachnellula occidentalis]